MKGALKTSTEKEEKKRESGMGWNYPVFWYAPRGNIAHRYNLQLKGPEEETFGPDALCRWGSFRTVGVQSNCWLLGVFTGSLLLHLHKCRGCPCTGLCQPSPKDFVGFVFCHPLSCCATLHELGTACWLQTAQLNLAEGEQALLHGPPWNACPRLLLSGNIFPHSSMQ